MLIEYIYEIKHLVQTYSNLNHDTILILCRCLENIEEQKYLKPTKGIKQTKMLLKIVRKLFIDKYTIQKNGLWVKCSGKVIQTFGLFPAVVRPGTYDPSDTPYGSEVIRL